MWRCERVEPRWKLWRPGWSYVWMLSSYGAFGGRTWTKREAEKRLAVGQAEMLSDG